MLGYYICTYGPAAICESHQQYNSDKNENDNPYEIVLSHKYKSNKNENGHLIWDSAFSRTGPLMDI